ncbi:MAG TPA: hypothetical protein VNW71_16515, partial [Thermoanaerobaculia bacterium]|nr:hypothetical protein [Thermoanaerobaculia bacterium]
TGVTAASASTQIPRMTLRFIGLLLTTGGNNHAGIQRKLLMSKVLRELSGIVKGGIAGSQ